MLFKPGGGRITRMHGAFVSDDDVVSVVSHWKKQLPPSYKVDFVEWATEGTGNVSGSMNGGASENYGTTDDPLYGECVAFVIENGKASISLIQRRFRIGFNKAARFVEQMEQDGVVGPADGSKPRTVLAKKEQPTG
jgi:S-DNA-T family DNA segregation ATPase FtsK/SpoIIIE